MSDIEERIKEIEELSLGQFETKLLEETAQRVVCTKCLETMTKFLELYGKQIIFSKPIVNKYTKLKLTKSGVKRFKPSNGIWYPISKVGDDEKVLFWKEVLTTISRHEGYYKLNTFIMTETEDEKDNRGHILNVHSIIFKEGPIGFLGNRKILIDCFDEKNNQLECLKAMSLVS